MGNLRKRGRCVCEVFVACAVLRGLLVPACESERGSVQCAAWLAAAAVFELVSVLFCGVPITPLVRPITHLAVAPDRSPTPYGSGKTRRAQSGETDNRDR